MHLFIAEVNALMNERLPYLIVRRIIQVLGSKGGLIDSRIARVSPLDDMLLN